MLTVILIIAALIVAEELVALITPLVVYGVTELVKKFLGSVSGWVIVMLIVPLLSIGVTWLSGLLLNTGMSFWEQAGFGLLAVFVNELLKQLKPKE